jgi:dTDP-glucose 4,6-dehydratase
MKTKFLNNTISQGFSLFTHDLQEIEQGIGALWDELRGARIFLTGGTGFFGIWLLESLLWANDRRNLGLSITVLTRSSEGFLNNKAWHLRGNVALRFVHGNLIDFIVPSADSGSSFTHIIHAASETNLDQTSDWAGRHLVAALDGTRKLLLMAKEHGVKGILLTTSGAVYFPFDSLIEDGRFVEMIAGTGDYAAEKMVYAQAKRMIEVMAAVDAMNHGYRVLIARCFCFVGPYLPLDSNYAIGNFIRDALDGREIVISGDGTPLRSYLYPVDMVVWLLKILLVGASGVPYNVGGDEAVSIAELAGLVAREADHDERVTILEKPVPGAIPNTYLPSIQRIREQLFVDVTVDLAEAIRRTLAWQSMRRIE